MIHRSPIKHKIFYFWGHHGHDSIIVGFTATYAISAYHHLSFEFKSHSSRGVLNTKVCDKVCLSVTFDRSVVFSEYFGFLHQ